MLRALRAVLADDTASGCDLSRDEIAQILAAVERLEQSARSALRERDRWRADAHHIDEAYIAAQEERDAWEAWYHQAERGIEGLEDSLRRRDEAVERHRREADASRRWARAWKALAHSHRVATRLWRALAQRDLPDPDVAARRQQARALREAVLAEARRRAGAERASATAAEPEP